MAIVADLKVVTGSVWQDAAGTQPATVGDPVGRIDDLSGNGHHATQSVTSAKPTLRRDAAGHLWVEFDGIDDHLRIDSLAAVLAGDDTPATVTAVAMTDAATGTRDLFGAGSASAGNPRHKVGTNGSSWILTRRDGAAGSAVSVSGGAVVTARRTLCYVSAGTGTIFVDNVQAATGDLSSAGEAALDQAAIGAGIRTGTLENFWDGGLYQLRVHDAALDEATRTAEFAALDAYYDAPAPGVPAEGLALGLRAWYEFDEAGGTRYDSHGSAHWTEVGTVGSAAGLRGEAVIFPAVIGDDNYLRQAPGALRTATGSFHVAFWVCYLGTGDGYTRTIITFGRNLGEAPDNTFSFMLACFPPAMYPLTAFIQPNGTIKNANPSSRAYSSSPFLVELFYDAEAGQCGCAINGGSFTTTSVAAGGLRIATEPVALGHGATSWIDQMGWWDRVLTAQERAALYNSGMGITYADIVPQEPADPSSPPGLLLLGVG